MSALNDQVEDIPSEEAGTLEEEAASAPTPARAPSPQKPLQTLPRYALSMLSWFFERQASAQADEQALVPAGGAPGAESGSADAMRLLRQHERAVLHKIIVWLHRIDAIEAPTSVLLPLQGAATPVLKLPVRDGKLLLTAQVIEALPQLATWHQNLHDRPAQAYAARLTSLLLHQARNQQTAPWSLEEEPWDEAGEVVHALHPLELVLIGRMGIELPRSRMIEFHAQTAPQSQGAWLWRSSTQALTDTLLEASLVAPRLGELYDALHIAHAAAGVCATLSGPTIRFAMADNSLWFVASDGVCVSIQQHSINKMGLLASAFWRIFEQTSPAG